MIKVWLGGVVRLRPFFIKYNLLPLYFHTLVIFPSLDSGTFREGFKTSKQWKTELGMNG